MPSTSIAGAFALALLGAALLLGACDEATPETTPTAPRRTATAGATTTVRSGLPTPTPGQPGTAVVAIDGVETELRVQQCVLSDEAVLVVGNQATPAASLTVVSVAGSTTITFNRDDVQWGVAAVKMTVAGNTASYAGPARRSAGTPAEVTMSLEVRCGS